MSRSPEQRAEFEEESQAILLIRQLDYPAIQRIRQITQTGISIEQDRIGGGNDIITLSCRTIEGKIYLNFTLPPNQGYSAKCRITEGEFTRDLTDGAVIIKDSTVIIVDSWPDRYDPRVTNATLITFSTKGIRFEPVFAPKENTLIGQAVQLIKQNHRRQ